MDIVKVANDQIIQECFMLHGSWVDCAQGIINKIGSKNFIEVKWSEPKSTTFPQYKKFEFFLPCYQKNEITICFQDVIGNCAKSKDGKNRFISLDLFDGDLKRFWSFFGFLISLSCYSIDTPMMHQLPLKLMLPVLNEKNICYDLPSDGTNWKNIGVFEQTPDGQKQVTLEEYDKIHGKRKMEIMLYSNAAQKGNAEIKFPFRIRRVILYPADTKILENMIPVPIS